MLDEFMKGKFYVDGKFVEPAPYVPTKEDKINAIKSEYEPLQILRRGSAQIVINGKTYWGH